MATAFPRWQVSVTVPPEAVKHFSKDMEIATTTEEGIAGQELTLEIGLLVKGAVLDATKIQRQRVQDLADRRRQVAALERTRRIGGGKGEAGAKSAGNTEAAHPVPTPALKQRQKQAQADATGRQLETTGAVLAVSNGLLATSQHTTPAKKGRTDLERQNADQDA